MLYEKPGFVILPLTGIIKNRKLWIEGQLLRTMDIHFHPAEAGENHWKNIQRIITAYLPGRIRSGNLVISAENHHHKITVNKKGVFSAEIDNITVNGEQNGFTYHLIRKGKRYRVQLPEKYSNGIHYFDDFKIGLISDIDDTVLVSHATNFIKRMQHLLIKNALRRKAVHDMAGFYQRLNDKKMPVFYVSNSEANLFPIISQFLHHHGFPSGPIFLRPYRKWKDLIRKRKDLPHLNHKKNKIRQILNIFPDQKFILVGDSSQKDPQIYYDIAINNPDRISKILIRDVHKSKKSINNKLREELMARTGIKTIYFESPLQIYD